MKQCPNCGSPYKKKCDFCGRDDFECVEKETDTINHILFGLGVLTSDEIKEEVFMAMIKKDQEAYSRDGEGLEEPVPPKVRTIRE